MSKLKRMFGILCLTGAVFTSTAQAEEIKYHFGGDDFPPFAFEENNQLTGLAVDILREILAELEIPDSIRLYPWARAYDIALKKQNALLFTAARTEEREDLFQWVGPIAPRVLGLFKLKSREDINIDTLEQAKRYRVGTINGYAAEKDLLNQGFEKGTNVIPVNSNIQNINKLYAKRIDMMTGIDLLIAHTLRETPHSFDEFERVMVLSDHTQFYYAFNKDTDEKIVARFQQVLDSMKTDGRYQALLDKYYQ